MAGNDLSPACAPSCLRHVGASPYEVRHVEYRARRGLERALFQELLTGKWIADKRNLDQGSPPFPVVSAKPGSPAR